MQQQVKTFYNFLRLISTNYYKFHMLQTLHNYIILCGVESFTCFYKHLHIHVIYYVMIYIF